MTKRPDWRREQIQDVIGPKIDTMLGTMALPNDAAHARRTIRSLLRIAADKAIEWGCPPDMFAQLANECFVKTLEGKDPEDGPPCVCGECDGKKEEEEEKIGPN